VCEKDEEPQEKRWRSEKKEKPHRQAGVEERSKTERLFKQHQSVSHLAVSVL